MQKETRRDFIKRIFKSLVTATGISSFALLFNFGTQYRFKPLWTVSQKIVSMKGGGKEKQFVVRPPGSRGEGDFLKKCIKCYLCVEACPLLAIKVLGREHGKAADTPFIIPEVTGCDLCLSRDKQYCNAICPTDALEKIPAEKDIVFDKLVMGKPQNMGIALLDKRVCYAWTKVSLCWACYEVCPYKGKAITTGDRNAPSPNAPAFHPKNCVGCSLCVEICPVPQKAIVMVYQGEKALIEASLDVPVQKPEGGQWQFDTEKIESRALTDDTINRLEDVEKEHKKEHPEGRKKSEDPGWESGKEHPEGQKKGSDGFNPSKVDVLKF